MGTVPSLSHVSKYRRFNLHSIHEAKRCVSLVADVMLKQLENSMKLLSTKTVIETVSM